MLLDCNGSTGADSMSLVRLGAILLCLIAVDAAVAAPAPAPAPAPAGCADENSLAKIPALQDADDFAALNRLAKACLDQKARFADGRWLLQGFHAAVQHAPDNATCEPCWRYHDDQTKRWLAATPNSPQPYIARAKMLLLRAWSYRGEAAASSVPPAVWKDVYKYAGEAEALLVRNKAVASADPEYYGTLLEIGLLNSVSGLNPDAVLAESAARFPGYMGTYFKAVFGRLPRWGGSYRRLDDLARYAATKSAATDKTGLYVRIYWFADDTHPGEFAAALASGAVDRPMLIASMRDVAAQFPVDWNIAKFAEISCFIGYGTESRRYAALVKDKQLARHVQAQAARCQSPRDPGVRVAALSLPPV